MWSDTLKERFQHRIRGDEIILKECPLCGNTHYNIEFNTEKEVFHCWVCEAKGTVRTFFRLYNLPFDENEWLPSRIKSKAKSETLILDEFYPMEFDSWPRFFKGRGLEPSDMRRYNFLASDKGRYKQAVIIPLYEGGKLVYFVARELRGKRYINPVVERSDIIPYFMGDRKSNVIHICEGAFDAISVNKLGYSSAVLLGTRIVAIQVRRLVEFGFIASVVMLDGDVQAKALTVYDILGNYGLHGSFVFMDKDEDPNSIYVKDKERLEHLIETAQPITTAERVQIGLKK